MPPPKSPSHGEFVTLKEYVESRIAAIDKGIEVANDAMQDRLEGMNEFRDTLRDQASRFVTRQEIEDKLNPINRDLRDLQQSKARLEGKASQTQANIILIISIIGLVLASISLLLMIFS